MPDEPEYAYLTTTGRRTGRPHRVELWYRRLGDIVWFIAGEGTASDWVQNLIVDPAVTLEIGDETQTGVAFVDDQEAPEARRALAARYQGWREGQPLSSWATGGMTVGVRLAPRSS